MFDPSKMFAGMNAQAMQPQPKVICGPGVQPDADWTKWRVLYPNYVDKKKTKAEGRRVPLEIAVESPKAQELFEICMHFGLQCVLEDKHYSRDWLVRGRIRVLLKTDDGRPCNVDVPNKDKLMHKMCEMIPNLKSRNVPVPSSASASSSQQKTGGAPKAKATSGGTPSSKKKGKKR